MRKQIIVGGVKIGAGAPVSVQSMTNTKTDNVPETVAQINRLAELGCEIVRVAVPGIAAAEAIGKIKEQISIPLVADIHFDHKLAIRAANAGADKIRINPGNLGGADNAKAVAKICKTKNLPIRIGVNSGSISDDILAKYGGVTADSLQASAMSHVELLNRFDFDDICISVKASSVSLTVAANRLLHESTDYPLHLGVTEAGTEYAGIIKSSVGIGALLLDGIGDTIRVSLTAPPEREIKAAIMLLKALGLRGGYELISCPSCGRCEIDLITIAEEVEHRLEKLAQGAGAVRHKENTFAAADYTGHRPPVTVAVMGCVVNGPGEASRADYGISGGNNEGIIFKKGKVVKKVPMHNLVNELLKSIESETIAF